MRVGSEIQGTDELKTSVANEEIIPTKQSFYKFSLLNEQDTTASINGSEPIFLRGGVGFSSDQVDTKIHSFKFLQDGIPYFWIGGK